jgi:hypothetical protein
MVAGLSRMVLGPMRGWWRSAAALVAATAATGARSQFQIMPSPCPSGMQYITSAQAQAQSAQICAMIGQWSIAEVGSHLGPGLAGSGYQCNFNPSACMDGSCQESVCVPAPPPGPPAPPPPPPPPPAPRRCFERGTQNLRLRATESLGDARSQSVLFSTAASKGMWEGATGNWAVQSITAGDPRGPGGFEIRGARCADYDGCSGVANVFNKVMYVAASKRTFTIVGNVSNNGTIVYTRCDSVTGEDGEMMAKSHYAISLIFPQFWVGPDNCTVGEGGTFPFALEPQRVGAVSFGAYGLGSDWGGAPALPGRAQSRLLVDESDDHFIPVSIDITHWYDDIEAVYSSSILYSDWTSDDTPIPEEEWDIPSVCFSRSDPSNRVWREAPPPKRPLLRSKRSRWEWWKE